MKTIFFNIKTQTKCTLAELRKWYEKNKGDYSIRGLYDNGFSYCRQEYTKDFKVIDEKWREMLDSLLGQPVGYGIRSTYLTAKVTGEEEVTFYVNFHDDREPRDTGGTVSFT